jgi:hypothetical protein
MFLQPTTATSRGRVPWHGSFQLKLDATKIPLRRDFSLGERKAKLAKATGQRQPSFRAQRGMLRYAGYDGPTGGAFVRKSIRSRGTTE